MNTFTFDEQEASSVAFNSAMGFVVVWESFGSNGGDTSFGSVLGQRFAGNGMRLGGEFQVNTYTLDHQDEPAVAMGSAGDFVVVWASEGSVGDDDSNSSIQARLYQSDGWPLGGQFQVNTNTLEGQDEPSVAVGTNGQFVVVWEGVGIQGQRFSADGTPLGEQFEVYSSGAAPSVAWNPAGGFAAVWAGADSPGDDTSLSSVQWRRFAVDGSPLGPASQVNTYTTGPQREPSLAFAEDGGAMVVWRSLGSAGADTSGSSIQGQRFDADGLPQGDEFEVNSYTTGYQGWPRVSAAAGDDMIVVWSGEGGADSSGIQGRRYSPNGPVGGEFSVNTYSDGEQYRPDVAMAPTGDFVVTWDSQGSPGTDDQFLSVQGLLIPRLIFSDGFESGDTSAWCVVVP